MENTREYIKKKTLDFLKAGNKIEKLEAVTDATNEEDIYERETIGVDSEETESIATHAVPQKVIAISKHLRKKFIAQHLEEIADSEILREE